MTSPTSKSAKRLAKAGWLVVDLVTEDMSQVWERLSRRVTVTNPVTDDPGR
jgi:hypothetical protein